jgi:hypothetical protein
MLFIISAAVFSMLGSCINCSASNRIHTKQHAFKQCQTTQMLFSADLSAAT